MARPVTVNGKARNIYLSDADVLALKLLGGTTSNGIRILLNVYANDNRNNRLPVDTVPND